MTSAAITTQITTVWPHRNAFIIITVIINFVKFAVSLAPLESKNQTNFLVTKSVQLICVTLKHDLHIAIRQISTQLQKNCKHNQ